ncbi:MAG: hypothetical protein CFH19_01043 [Alphaproteobacteria bacterium MarineAlpha5_Bin9]|nr:MAG: hypothetical protein CFH19_01043 [Alphaproteobacteria bacterium MarineAlpha5_Bin9]|tara:strand:- start:7007 stop:7984 length:978 start_codon:yes stop_codon:yes gene_type:complete
MLNKIIYTLFFLILCSSLNAKNTGLIFVSNEKTDDLTVIDPDTLEIVTSIPTSERPRDMHFNEDRSLIYVACGDDDVIDIVDISTFTVIGSLDTGPSPEAFQFSPDYKYIYVSNEEDSTLGVLNVEENAIMDAIPTGAEPEGVLTSKDGSIVYVTSEVADMVHVVDSEGLFVSENIFVGTRPRRLATTADEKELWVSAELSGEMYIIDTASYEVTDIIKFLPPGFRDEDVTPVGFRLNKAGTKAYIGLGRANHIAIVDVKTREIEDYILVGSRAWEVELSKDEKTLYVANGLSDDISIINLENNTVIKSVAVGRVPYKVLIDYKE